MPGQFASQTTLTLGVDLIAELTNIGGPSMSADSIDISSHDSADHYREFVAGMKDAGEITVEGNLISAVQGNLMLANLTSGAEVVVLITFPSDPATFTGAGFVTAYEPAAPFEDKLSFTATFKLTGKPELA